MASVTMRDARAKFGYLGDLARFKGERVVVTRHNKPAFAIISMDDLQLLEKLEDHMDIEAVKAALAEGKTRPFEEFAKELGL